MCCSVGIYPMRVYKGYKKGYIKGIYPVLAGILDVGIFRV
jgi:hypothetical protein